MTKRLILGLSAALLFGGVLAGCSDSSKSSSDAAPKGARPETVQAPAGAEDPETRGMKERNAREGGGGGGT